MTSLTDTLRDIASSNERATSIVRSLNREAAKHEDTIPCQIDCDISVRQLAEALAKGGFVIRINAESRGLYITRDPVLVESQRLEREFSVRRQEIQAEEEGK